MPELIIRLGDTIVQRFAFDKDVVSLGRARDNDIVVENLSVSRNHARLRLQDGAYVITDLNSANGTYLNGQRVTKAEVSDNDTISIGKHRLTFTLGAAPASEEPPPPAAPESSSAVSASAAPAKQKSTAAPLKDTDDAILVVTRGPQADKVFPVPREGVTIGRSNNAGIRLYDWNAGKEHASIERRENAYLLRDLGSWRGVVVNGEQVSEALLKSGDEIVLGSTVLTYKVGDFGDLIEDLKSESLTAKNRALEIPEDPTPVTDKAPPGKPRRDVFEDEMSSLDPVAAESMVESGRSGDTIEVGTDDHTSSDAAAASEEDDEFAPMTDEELAELEMEADEIHSQEDPGIAARMELEQLEAEKLLEAGGGWRAGGLIEEDEVLAGEEDAAVPEPDAADIMEAQMEAEEFIDEDVEDAEEEQSLFRGPVSSAEPGSIKDPEAPAPATATAPETSSASPGSLPAPASVDEMQLPEGVDPAEVKRWLRGLKNKSRLIRREASRKIKDLTGVEYDWETPPAR